MCGDDKEQRSVLENEKRGFGHSLLVEEASSLYISVPASSGSAEVATNPVCDRNITSSLIVKVTIAVVKQYKACLQSSALSILRRRALSR